MMININFQARALGPQSFLPRETYFRAPQFFQFCHGKNNISGEGGENNMSDKIKWMIILFASDREK